MNDMASRFANFVGDRFGLPNIVDSSKIERVSVRNDIGRHLYYLSNAESSACLRFKRIM